MKMRDEIISKTVVGLLVLAISGLAVWVWREWFQKAMAWGWAHFLALLAWLGQSVSVPRWWLYLLITIAALVVVGVFIVILAFWRRPQEVETTWRDYREDDHFGVRWRWSYYGGGTIDDLVCYCPTCDRGLTYSDAGSMSSGIPT